MQNWIECNQAPYDDLFYQDLLQEWNLSGSLYDFNDGIARMAFMYSAQVRKEISLLNIFVEFSKQSSYLEGFRISPSQR